MRIITASLAILLVASGAWAGDAVTITDKVAKITKTYQDDLEALAKDPAVVANIIAANDKVLDEAAAKALQAKWLSDSKDLAYAKPYTDNKAAAAFSDAMGIFRRASQMRRAVKPSFKAHMPNILRRAIPGEEGRVGVITPPAAAAVRPRTRLAGVRGRTRSRLP